MDKGSIKYNREYSLYEVDENTINKLQKLVSTNSFLDSFLNEIKNSKNTPYKIKYEDFKELINWVISGLDIRYELNPFAIDFNAPTYFDGFKEKYNELIQRYVDIRKIENKDDLRSSLNRACEEILEKEDLISEVLDLGISIEKNYVDYYYLRDLDIAKNNIEENLKYFVDQDTINTYVSKMDEALNKYDIETAKSILDEVQELTLKHYKEYVTDINKYKPGEEFRLICHSTPFTERKEDFKTRYVSTSLLSDKVFDTFASCNFGFILPPENIVGAKPRDMYVNNNLKDDSKLPYSSSVKTIDSPERLVEECAKLKELNIENNSSQIVYNEIAIDGFNPIGIFCISDGSKELNPYYQNAKKLQMQFPNLKIVDIDQTLYKTELQDVKKDLYQRIRERILKENPEYSNYSEYELRSLASVGTDKVKRYDLFWDNYMELKKDGNIDIDQIIKLYKNCDNLVTMDITNKDVFDQLSDKELEYILKFNYNVDINDVLTGNINVLTLDKIYNSLSDYKNIQRLNKLIPGLATFLSIYRKLELPLYITNELYNCSSFDQINEIIIEYIKSYNDRSMREIEVISDLKRNTQNQIENLKANIAKNEQTLQNLNRSNNIIDKEYLYSMANLDINFTLKNITDHEIRREDFKEEKTKSEQSLSEINASLNKLNKHKILNFFKIRRVNKEKNKEEDNLDSINRKIEQLNKSIEELQAIIQNAKNNFAEDTGIEFERFTNELEKAKKIVDTIDPYDIVAQISTAELVISKLENSLSELEKQAADIKINDIIKLDDINSVTKEDTTR